MENSSSALIGYKYRCTKVSYWISRQQKMFYIDDKPRISGNQIDIFLEKSGEGLWLKRVTIKSLRDNKEKKIYREREVVKIGISGRFNQELDGHMNETIGKNLSLLTYADEVLDNTNKSLTAISNSDALNSIFLCLSKNFKLEKMAKRYLDPEEQIVY